MTRVFQTYMIARYLLGLVCKACWRSLVSDFRCIYCDSEKTDWRDSSLVCRNCDLA